MIYNLNYENANSPQMSLTECIHDFGPTLHITQESEQAGPSGRITASQDITLEIWSWARKYVCLLCEAKKLFSF